MLQGLEECTYGAWYLRYTSLAAASRVIVLDQAAVDFLHEDGLVLHDASAALPQRAKASEVIVEGVDYDPDDLYSSSSSSDAGSDSGSSDSAESQQPWSLRFPELHAAIAAAISELGGAVAPRLNWSSPSDALWLSSSNSLRCTNPDEVLLLLKGSDRVAHDLDQLQELNNSSMPQQQRQQHQPSQQQQQPSRQQPLPAQLVLRAWQDLAPEWQFRAFVHQHTIAAISQRDPSQHFPQLTSAEPAAAQEAAEGNGRHQPQQQQQQQQQGILGRIQSRLLDAHRRHIGSSFPLQSYAVDMYVPPSGPVLLLDVSPIRSTTSPLCFAWEDLPYAHMHTQEQQHQQQQQQGDLQQEQQQQPANGRVQAAPGDSGSVQFRVVKSEGCILPGARVATGMPYDMLGLPDAVTAVMAAMQQQQVH